jgi:hypothetical protein
MASDTAQGTTMGDAEPTAFSSGATADQQSKIEFQPMHGVHVHVRFAKKQTFC